LSRNAGSGLKSILIHNPASNFVYIIYIYASPHLTSYETHKRAIRLKPLLLEETPKICTTQGAWLKPILASIFRNFANENRVLIVLSNNLKNGIF
jgi:hypothetical protein